MRPVSYGLLGLFALDVAALAAVGGLSWRRLSDLRFGLQSGGEIPPSGPRPSSPTTWLAAAGGLFALAFGVSSWRTTGPGPAVVAGVWGTLVLVTGLAGRVSCLAWGVSCAVVHRTATPRLVIRWSELSELRPPRSPLGGWTFGCRSGSPRLMPSDLLGREDVLRFAVRRAGLVFDGRVWRRPGDPSCRASSSDTCPRTRPCP